jgi:alkylhydroperoxidase family enzyme
VDGEGRLLGPFNAMLANPAVGDALQQLGAVIRYGASLPGRVRELAILVVAAHRQSTFEWYAHQEPARDAGLPEGTVAGIRAGGRGLIGDDALVNRAVLGLLTDREWDDETFAAVRDLLGIAGAVELVALVGYYDLLDLTMSTFRAGIPEGARLEW